MYKCLLLNYSCVLNCYLCQQSDGHAEKSLGLLAMCLWMWCSRHLGFETLPPTVCYCSTQNRDPSATICLWVALAHACDLHQLCMHTYAHMHMYKNVFYVFTVLLASWGFELCEKHPQCAQNIAPYLKYIHV